MLPDRLAGLGTRLCMVCMYICVHRCVCRYCVCMLVSLCVICQLLCHMGAEGIIDLDTCERNAHRPVR